MLNRSARYSQAKEDLEAEMAIRPSGPEALNVTVQILPGHRSLTRVVIRSIIRPASTGRRGKSDLLP